MSDDGLIDTCIEWIAERNAAYLAKEDKIVYYQSITLRKQDETWHKLSPVQVLRIIKTTKMVGDQQSKLKTHHIISAFQELGEAYEYGVTSPFPTPDNIYNYHTHTDLPKSALVMEALAEELYARSFHGLLLSDISDMHAAALSMIGGKQENAMVRNTYMYKYFPPLGYVIRVGPQRMNYKGIKRQAVMMPGKAPKTVGLMSDIDKAYVTQRVADKYT